VTDVSEQTRSGISWNFVGAIATNAMRIITVVVLGRLLDEHDFGIVAAATSVLVVLHYLRDIGLGQALVQREDLTREHEATAFATSVYLGIAFAVAIVLAAPVIGELYGIPESVGVLRALGVIFALRGLGTVSQMMCQRAMRFRAVAIVDVSSYGAGTIVSMALAALGFGPWSLVAGYLTEEALAMAMYLAWYRPPLTLRVDGRRLGELMGFGTGQAITQLSGVLATEGDNMVVGRTLGAGPLGFYTRAYLLIKLPSTMFSTIVGNVLFPAFSRWQADPDKLAVGFRRTTFANALLLLPAGAALVAVAPEMIRLLMGPRWDAAVLPFRILAITIMFRTNFKVGALVASAAGAINGVAIAHVVYMIFVIGGAAIANRWGIEGVAVSTALAITVVYLECCYLGLAVSRLGARALVSAHLPGLGLAAIVLAASWPLATAMRDNGVHFAVTFTAIAVISIAISVVGVALGIRGGRGDFGWLGEELSRVWSRIRRKR
jgi:O-antigen/teichoic acid export membrane protein